MAHDVLAASKPATPAAVPPPAPPGRHWEPPPEECLGAARAALLDAGGFVLVALIALLDYATGPDLSLSIFYLVPAVACAWRGGFSHGLLLALAAAVARQVVERVEHPAVPAAVGVWNGVVQFGTLTLAASLVCRLRA